MGLGVGAFYLGYREIAAGILWGLPLGLFNYYLACRAVGYLGKERGTRLFAGLVACRWALALVALFLAVRGGVGLLVGVALGVEIQVLSQLLDAAAVLVGLRRTG